jgi:hypothetical protein
MYVSMKTCLLSLEMDLPLVVEYKKRMIISLIKITTTKSLVNLFLLTKKEGLILYCLLYFLSVCVFFNLITHSRKALRTRANLRS